jgi:CheY-like chemotaxis protein
VISNQFQPCERVLVVDDNRDMLGSMKDVLELGGARVATATSREQADSIIAGGFDPSVVVLDVRLGGGDRGDDYAHALQATRPGTPIVLMSGDVHELRRLDDEVDATIPKPFDIDRLFEVLSEMCARRRSS